MTGTKLLAAFRSSQAVGNCKQLNIMPRKFNRAERVADFIKREVATLFQQEIRDPRTKATNVNAVVVSKDLSVAKVYVTFWNSPDGKALDESIEALNQASGFIRSRLAAIGNMRRTPRLQFIYDKSVHSPID